MEGAAGGVSEPLPQVLLKSRLDTFSPDMLVPALKRAERRRVLLLSPVLDGGCMEGHQHVDCGRTQLDDGLFSCLKVFFTLNRGFVLHYSGVSRRVLEAGEVPGACLEPPGSQASPVK